MHILVTGGTGLIGSYLVPSLQQSHKVAVLTRNVASAERALGAKVAYFSSLDQFKDLDKFDAVINLAGEPIVNKRWSDSQKRLIEQSRWQTTEKLVQLIAASDSPPHTFISGSAIGYYGRQGDTTITEDFEQPYDEFSHRLCKQWEEIALGAQSEKTRVCLLRTGIVLSSHGGALVKMLPPFRWGLGGPIGDGQQYMSWIHIADMVGAILHLLNRDESQGAYNLTAPEPVTNQVFSHKLAEVLNKPCFMKTPAFMLRLALGEMADLLLYGQRVVPAKLLEEGYQFKHSTLNEAFEHLNIQNL